MEYNLGNNWASDFTREADLKLRARLLLNCMKKSFGILIYDTWSKRQLFSPTDKLNVGEHFGFVYCQISNGNRTEWSKVQGVIGRVISNFDLKLRI